jgi:hypothetical protein
MGKYPMLQKSLPIRIFEALSLPKAKKRDKRIESPGFREIHKKTWLAVGEFIAADRASAGAFGGIRFMLWFNNCSSELF